MKNLNDWAREITIKEGKKISISIAQVKEILKIILQDISKMPIDTFQKLIIGAKNIKGRIKTKK